MVNYNQFFKGKKITVMGLGLLGGAVNDIIYLAGQGADLIVTDLKTEEVLKKSVLKLKKYPKIKFVLGEHRLEDFENADMILQPGNVPVDSLYFKKAKENNIPIMVSESVFAKYMPEGVMMIGVTGTRGKSMTTMLIYEILKQNLKGKKVYLGGNVRDVSTTALLSKVKAGDVVVLELDSWALSGMGAVGKSPHISVFTSFMPDHMNYYKNSMEDYFADKALIFKNQKENDFLITDTKIKNLIRTIPKSQIILANKKSVADFDFIVPGEHQRQNLAYAVAVAEILGISKDAIRKTVKKFKGVEGRLEYLRIYKGVKIYNDNNATTPEATIAGVKAVKGEGKGVVLLCGGADKKVDLNEFTKEVNKNCKFVSLIPGTGTDKLVSSGKLLVISKKAKDFKDAIKNALLHAKRGDVLLFSPAFASFGLFNNEYERNDLFVKIIKGLK